MQRRSFVLLALAALATGCERWKLLQPQTLYFRDPDLAFNSAVATLRRFKYNVMRISRPQFHLEVESKHPGSFISMQIYSDGRMIIRPYGGRLVRGNTIHRALEQEIGSLIAALRATGHLAR